jgi:hypothetical protein
MGRIGPVSCARGPAAHAWSTRYKADLTAIPLQPSLRSSHIPRGPEPLCPTGDIQDPSLLVSISARPPACRSLAVKPVAPSSSRPEVRAKSLHPWRGQSTGPHNRANEPHSSPLGAREIKASVAQPMQYTGPFSPVYFYGSAFTEFTG